MVKSEEISVIGLARLLDTSRFLQTEIGVRRDPGNRDYPVDSYKKSIEVLLHVLFRGRQATPLEQWTLRKDVRSNMSFFIDNLFFCCVVIQQEIDSALWSERPPCRIRQVWLPHVLYSCCILAFKICWKKCLCFFRDLDYYAPPPLNRSKVNITPMDFLIVFGQLFLFSSLKTWCFFQRKPPSIHAPRF